MLRRSGMFRVCLLASLLTACGGGGGDDAIVTPPDLSGVWAGSWQGQGDPVLRDWARDLSGQLPRSLAGVCLYRRLRTAFDCVRLQRLADGRGFAPPPAAATVWRAWRVARSA